VSQQANARRNMPRSVLLDDHAALYVRPKRFHMREGRALLSRCGSNMQTNTSVPNMHGRKVNVDAGALLTACLRRPAIETNCQVGPNDDTEGGRAHNGDGAVHDLRAEGDDHESVEEHLEVARPRRQHPLHLPRHLRARGVAGVSQEHRFQGRLAAEDGRTDALRTCTKRPASRRSLSGVLSPLERGHMPRDEGQPAKPCHISHVHTDSPAPCAFHAMFVTASFAASWAKAFHRN